MFPFNKLTVTLLPLIVVLSFSSFVVTASSSPPPNPLNCSSSSSAIIINHTTCESCATNYSCQDPSYNATDFISPWMCIFNGSVVRKCYTSPDYCNKDCTEIFGYPTWNTYSACVRSSSVPSLSYVDVDTKMSVSYSSEQLCNTNGSAPLNASFPFERVNFNYCPTYLTTAPFSAATTCNYCRSGCAFQFGNQNYNLDAHYCYKVSMCFVSFSACAAHPQCTQLDCLPVTYSDVVCNSEFNTCPALPNSTATTTTTTTVPPVTSTSLAPPPTLPPHPSFIVSFATCLFCTTQCRRYNDSYLLQLETPFTRHDDTHVCLSGRDTYHGQICYGDYYSCSVSDCLDSCVPTSRLIQLKLQNPKKLWGNPYQDIRNDFCLRKDFNNCNNVGALLPGAAPSFTTCEYCLAICSDVIYSNYSGTPTYNRRTGLCFSSLESCFNDNITDPKTKNNDCIQYEYFCNISIPFDGLVTPSPGPNGLRDPKNPFPVPEWVIAVVCIVSAIGIFGVGIWGYRKVSEKSKPSSSSTASERAPLLAGAETTNRNLMGDADLVRHVQQATTMSPRQNNQVAIQEEAVYHLPEDRAFGEVRTADETHEIEIRQDEKYKETK